MVKDLETYTKEIHRKHLRELGYRAFQHPSYSSAIVLVKAGQIRGMTDKGILKDNSRTRGILERGELMPFTY